MRSIKEPWYLFMSDEEWKVYLTELLQTELVAILKATVILYDFQTDYEKLTNIGKEVNGKGFNRYDALELSLIAKKIKDDKPITQQELKTLRLKVPKYWRQLMEVSISKMSQPTYIDDIESSDELQKRLCEAYGVPCEYGICSECERN